MSRIDPLKGIGESLFHQSLLQRRLFRRRRYFGGGPI